MGIKEFFQDAARKNVPPAVQVIDKIMLMVGDTVLVPGNVNGKIRTGIVS